MSDRLLDRLSRVNRTTAFLIALGVMLLGLFLPGLGGGLILLAVAAGLGWLLARTWPVVPPAMRAVRLVMLGLLLALAIVKVT